MHFEAQGIFLIDLKSFVSFSLLVRCDQLFLTFSSLFLFESCCLCRVYSIVPVNGGSSLLSGRGDKDGVSGKKCIVKPVPSRVIESVDFFLLGFPPISLAFPEIT